MMAFKFGRHPLKKRETVDLKLLRLLSQFNGPEWTMFTLNSDGEIDIRKTTFIEDQSTDLRVRFVFDFSVHRYRLLEHIIYQFGQNVKRQKMRRAETCDFVKWSQLLHAAAYRTIMQLEANKN